MFNVMSHLHEFCCDIMWGVVLLCSLFSVICIKRVFEGAYISPSDGEVPVQCFGNYFLFPAYEGKFNGIN